MRIMVDTTCPTCGATVADDDAYCRSCGFSQPHAAPSTTSTALEPVDPRALPPLLPTQPSRAALFTALGIVLLLVGVSVPVLVIRAVFFGPDDVVRGYFNALAARRADAAWATLEMDGAARAGNPLLGGAALRDAGYLPPSNATIEKLTVDNADATALVRFEAGGSSQVVELRVHRGRARNVFERWHIENGLLPLELALPDAGQFRVGGALVDPRQLGSGGLSVFPGAYVVTLPDNPLLRADPVTVVAGLPPRTALQPQVQPSAQQEIERQVKAAIDKCAASTQRQPPNCPFAASSGFEEPVRWTVLAYPTLRTQLVEGGQVYVDSVNAGTVRITGGPGSYYSPSTYSYRISGPVAVNGEFITFTPDGS